MRLAYLEIRNFRGIKELDWAPRAGINCLIGPGDSTKTTVLDAIELVLNPRWNWMADDSDFYNLDVDQPVTITATLIDLPQEIKSDANHGLHLRGWDTESSNIVDEPSESLEEALSIRVTIDKALEAKWGIYNERLDPNEDLPYVRSKLARALATTRLGPYADHHLTWGRRSVLSRLEDEENDISIHLAEASRAARKQFKEANPELFQRTIERTVELSKEFLVPVRDAFKASIDIQGAALTSGGLSLHDGDLPLKKLGTGSSRLLVAGLQHGSGEVHIALIDEVEHGLEPHRIARLLKHLAAPASTGEPPDAESMPPQVFMTTHSPVVIRELYAHSIYVSRSESGTTTIKSVQGLNDDDDKPQSYLRRSPYAYLARRVLIGEGKTECGFARGLDHWWVESGKRNSYALRGVVSVHADGGADSLRFAAHLLDLGYTILVLMDSDAEKFEEESKIVTSLGGTVVRWEGKCATEQRIFQDVPWALMDDLIKIAIARKGRDSVEQHAKNSCERQGVTYQDINALSTKQEFPGLREALASAAKVGEWYKDIEPAEKVAEVIAPKLKEMKDTPLARSIVELRKWVDDGDV